MVASIPLRFYYTCTKCNLNSVEFVTKDGKVPSGTQKFMKDRGWYLSVDICLCPKCNKRDPTKTHHSLLKYKLKDKTSNFQL